MARTAGKYHQPISRRSFSTKRRLFDVAPTVKKLPQNNRPKAYEFDIIARPTSPAKYTRVLDVDKKTLKKIKKTHKRPRTKAKLVSNILLAASVPLILFLAYAGYGYYKTTHKLESKISENQSVLGDVSDEAVPEHADAESPDQLADTAKPSEAPKKTGPYVPKNPLAPRTMKIPSLGVNASFVTVGLTKKGAMGVPGDIFTVGWYKNSPSPGDNTGVSVVNGHVFGPTKPGVFANLKNIKEGAQVDVVLANGTKLSYKVVRKATFKAGEAQGEAMSGVSSKPGLNLITCTGALKGDEYQDRLVVYTERI